MKFDFSYTKSPLTTPPVALTTVYFIQANSTYDVWKYELDHKGLVALRTISGRGYINIEGMEEIIVGPETLLLFENRMIRHYYCKDTWDFWWFGFITDNCISLPFDKVLSIDMVDRETADCNACLNLLKENDSMSRYLASATLNLLINKWMYYLDKKEPRNPHKPAIDKVLSYINSNMSNYVTIKEMASVAGLSERRFREVFCEIMGMPPKRYYDALRIDTAKELLRNTPLTISQIAFRLGYSSQFHFARAFQNECGISPSHFRKLI